MLQYVARKVAQRLIVQNSIIKTTRVITTSPELVNQVNQANMKSLG